MRRLSSLLLLLVALLGVQAPALAKLEPAEWKVVEQEFARLYTPSPGLVGFEADKGSLLNLLIQDGEARSFKLLGDALVAECTLWLNAQKAVAETTEAIGVVLTKPSKARTPEEEAKMFQLQKQLPRLEDDARIERVIMGNIVKAIGGGPAPVKAALYARAKSSPDWTLRSAVAQVAGAEPTEKDAASFLVRSLAPSTEKDPRVRAAALEGLAANPAGAEDHVIGRLADPDWQVQLLAVRHVRAHKLMQAIPHMITGLDAAAPRMRDELGSALKELTGQNFDPYADVWAKWWEDNREKVQGAGPAKVGSRPSNPVVDPELYGVPVKSDRVLFVIDISGSMKESIKKPPVAPDPVVTPAEGAPPPPEEMDLGGPKVNVAVDQVRKAIERLTPKSVFAMIAFNHAVIVWKDAPVPATKENKEDAYKWLRSWQWQPGPNYAQNERQNGTGSPGPSGSTYVEGALRTAFTKVAGVGTVDKAYPEVRVDTIVFLCDGAPTDNAVDASKLVPTDPILARVREWNPRKAITIHAIAIDMTNEVSGNAFMKALAAENNGTFTPIPKPKGRKPDAPPPAPAPAPAPSK